MPKAREIYQDFNIAIDSFLSFDFIYPLSILPDIKININEEVLGRAQEAIISDRVDLATGIGPEPRHEISQNPAN